MKYKFIEREFKYDGKQLSSLFAYLDYEILRDSIVSWVGPCEITPEHMVDGEDLLQKAEIKGDLMLHFIVEKFQVDLFAGVSLQRLLASLVIDCLKKLSDQNLITQNLYRDGDDIFYKDQKHSISIATQSPTSTLIHFAVNVSNAGTPVKTLSLEEMGVEPRALADLVMDSFSKEVHTITEATQKVKWVK